LASNWGLQTNKQHSGIKLFGVDCDS